MSVGALNTEIPRPRVTWGEVRASFEAAADADVVPVRPSSSMEQARKENRACRYLISVECLIDYLRRQDQMPSCIMTCNVQGPPADAEIERVYYEPGRNCLVAVVIHPSFEKCPWGACLPLATEAATVTQHKLLVRREDGSYRFPDQP